MTVRLSATVMAHPRRADTAQAIARDTGLGAHVVFDPRPDGPRGTLRTALLAWRAADPLATHHLVLQDDVALCPDFDRHVREAVASRPTDPIFLFAGWGTRCAPVMVLAALNGLSWAEAVEPVPPAQAVILPADHIEAFLTYVDDHDLPDDDALALRDYLQHADTTGYVTVPNLVEHLALPSLLDNDLLLGHRKSACYTSPRDTGHWTADAVTGLPLVPHFHTGRSMCLLRKNGDWDAVTTHEWLDGQGVALMERISLFRADFDTAPTPKAAEVISPTLFFEFWLTGFMLGVASTALGPVIPRRLTGDALVQRALGGIFAGGVRRLLAPALAEAATDELVPLLKAGIDSGAASGLKPE